MAKRAPSKGPASPFLALIDAAKKKPKPRPSPYVDPQVAVREERRNAQHNKDNS